MVIDLNDAIDDIKELMPLLEEVTNPALQPRHWIEIIATIDALQLLCPEELERRERILEAKKLGEEVDLSDLVRTPLDWLSFLGVVQTLCEVS